jgi:hypothetical protein
VAAHGCHLAKASEPRRALHMTARASRVLWAISLFRSNCAKVARPLAIASPAGVAVSTFRSNAHERPLLPSSAIHRRGEIKRGPAQSVSFATTTVSATLRFQRL